MLKIADLMAPILVKKPSNAAATVSNLVVPDKKYENTNAYLEPQKRDVIEQRRNLDRTVNERFSKGDGDH